MEVQRERMDRVLTLVLSGRLDAFGAQQLSEEANKALQDDDQDLIIDLTEAPYLSSGGIRVFLLLLRGMQRRNGRFILTGVGEYPRKVLALAGFQTVFETFSTVQEAIADIHKRREPQPKEKDWKKIKEGGVTLSIEPVWVPAQPVLRVMGSLDRLLHARLTETDIHTKGFQEIDYSLGLGALGTNLQDALLLLGEMITLHGSMVWLPTDGHSTPDFLTPRSTGDVPVYVGYDVTLEGSFNEYLVLETEDPQGVLLSDIYRAIFAGAKDRVKDWHGVVALAIWGIIAKFASSGLKKSPIATFAPPGGASILDPSQIQDWMESDVGVDYAGDTLVSFGIGVDLGSDLSHFDPQMLAALHYTNPLNREGTGGLYLHNHGVVFRNVPYDASLDLNTEVKRCVTEGEFVDMRHLLDSTRLRRAKIGVAYIQQIAREP
jgi:anti-anti-sigma factor